MLKKPASAVQLTLPFQDDTGLLRVAEGEATRLDLKAAVQEIRVFELLSTITGLRPEQAEEVVKAAGGLHQLARLPEHTLRLLPHIGEKRAGQIHAMTEWAVILSRIERGVQKQIHSPADVANMVMLEMGLLEQEELRVVGLDTKNYISFMNTIYRGSLNTAVVRIAEVLRAPIAWQCASMVIIHNHPSGDPTPSAEDVRVTEMIREGGQLFDIALLDHIIIGLNRYTSLKERGLGFA